MDPQEPTIFKRILPVALIPLAVMIAVVCGPIVTNSVPTLSAVSAFAASHPYWYSAIVGMFALIGATGSILLNEKTWRKRYRPVSVDEYRAMLKPGHATVYSRADYFGVEMSIVNSTGYRVDLSVRRNRVLYDKCSCDARVEVSRSIAANDRGVIRILMPIDRIKADHAAGKLKDLDVEDLRVMARISDGGHIVCDVIAPMPEREAFSLFLDNGVWKLGKTQYAQASPEGYHV